MAIIIRRTPTDGGANYEIENFQAYVDALQQRGIEPPRARYRIFVSHVTEQAMQQSVNDFDSQLGLFFRLGPTAGIDFEVRT